MPTYLRKWRDRYILVRPTKWDGAEEVAPWDCLDFTDAIKTAEESVVPIALWLNRLETTIERVLREQPHLYRSKPFARTHKDNPRMENPLFGCCVVATEAIWFLAQHYLLTIGDEYENKYGDRGGKVEPWKVKDLDGIYHWYIMATHDAEPPWQTKSYKMETDATVSQFPPALVEQPQYADGKKTALMGWKQSPSKRTLDLIENALTSSNRYSTFDTSYANPNMAGTLDAFLSDD